MNIRTRITLIFFFLVIFIVTAISISIYYFSSHYREDDFSRRLRNRSVNTAKMLLNFQQINAELLMKLERDNPASLPNQIVKIFGPSNELLYSSDEENILPATAVELEKVRAGNEVRIEIRGYEIIGFRYPQEDGDYIVFAGATDVFGHDALRNLRNIIFITFCFSVLIVSVVGYIYSGRVLKPILKIVHEVESITEESLDKRLDEGNKNDELGKLARTFNGMLARLQSAFLAQKNFIANASHELKTPFTVMAGEIEVTLLHPREKDYYIRILRSVLDGIKRFNKLSTQLLLLAQTSSDSPNRKFSLLRIDDILWEAKQELEKYHPEYKIEIVFDMEISHDILLVSGDEQLLKVLIMNLMDNGCKYSDQSSVLIRISKSVDNFLYIGFQNSGEGIEMAELEKIFDPFYRAKSSVKQKGFGIGLSLAAKIVQLHQGRISVSSVPRGITEFKLLLPFVHQP